MQTFGLRAVSDGPLRGKYQIHSARVAIFHLAVKPVSRSDGRSATGAAAYRAGDKITDELTGVVHDYRRRSGVVETVQAAPAGCAWALNRPTLWNAAEQSECKKNGEPAKNRVVAREIEVALPHELDQEQRRALVEQFANELVFHHGVAVDAAIHAPGKEGDHRNHHAHVLITSRRVGLDGLGAKTREWDDRSTKTVNFWRERWAELTNSALEAAGRPERVDHRTLAEQGIGRAPGVHLGPKATQFERDTGEPSRIRTDAERLQQDLRERAQQQARQVVAEAEVQARAAVDELERLRGEAARRPAPQPDQVKPTPAPAEAARKPQEPAQPPAAPEVPLTPLERLERAQKGLAEAVEQRQQLTDRMRLIERLERQGRETADQDARQAGRQRQRLAAQRLQKLAGQLDQVQAGARTWRTAWGLMKPSPAVQQRLEQLQTQITEQRRAHGWGQRLERDGLAAMSPDKARAAVQRATEPLMAQHQGLPPTEVAKRLVEAPAAVDRAERHLASVQADPDVGQALAMFTAAGEAAAASARASADQGSSSDDTPQFRMTGQGDIDRRSSKEIEADARERSAARRPMYRPAPRR